MKTKIALIGLGFDKPEIIERFDGTEAELIKRLKELQSGYCEDEKPKIQRFKANGRIFIEAVSKTRRARNQEGENRNVQYHKLQNHAETISRNRITSRIGNLDSEQRRFA